MSDARPTKQVIVMRKDLNMRKGKMIAQGAHASIAWLTRSILGVISEVVLSPPQAVWLESSFKKICLYVTSEEDLLVINTTAAALGIEVHLIQDAGLTEFGGVPTYTCLALGPDYDDRIDLVTGDDGPLGRLPLL